MSTATTFPAWARSAPTTALTPTPPHPMTTTVDPTSTRAALNTAPRPVDTPHASVATFSSATSDRIRTTAPSGTTARSAKDDCANQWYTGRPRRLRRVVPSGSLPLNIVAPATEQSHGRPSTHSAHRPQRPIAERIT